MKVPWRWCQCFIRAGPASVFYRVAAPRAVCFEILVASNRGRECVFTRESITNLKELFRNLPTRRFGPFLLKCSFSREHKIWSCASCGIASQHDRTMQRCAKRESILNCFWNIIVYVCWSNELLEDGVDSFSCGRGTEYASIIQHIW